MHPTCGPIIWTWTRFTLCFEKFKSALFKIVATKYCNPSAIMEMQCMIDRDCVTEITWEGITTPIRATFVFNQIKILHASSRWQNDYSVNGVHNQSETKLKDGNKCNKLKQISFNRHFKSFIAMMFWTIFLDFNF